MNPFASHITHQITNKIPNKVTRLSLAPMVDVTHPPFRHMIRLSSKNTVLYTPMIVSMQLLRSDFRTRSALLTSFPFENENTVGSDNNLQHNNSQENQLISSNYNSIDLSTTLPKEHKTTQTQALSILQLSGSDPELLYKAAKITEASGYQAININMGCPAPSAQRSIHGAALMLHDPFLETFYQLQNQVSIPVSIKCRLGVNQDANYEWFLDFIKRCIIIGGCKHFIIHSRVALLNLKTRGNVSIPPIRADFIYRLYSDINIFLEQVHGAENDTDTRRIFDHCELYNGEIISINKYKSRIPQQITLEYNGQLFSADGGIRRIFGLSLDDKTPNSHSHDDKSYQEELSKVREEYKIISSMSSANADADNVSNSNRVNFNGSMVGRAFQRSILFGVENDVLTNMLSSYHRNDLIETSSIKNLINPTTIYGSQNDLLNPDFSRLDILHIYLCSLERIYFPEKSSPDFANLQFAWNYASGGISGNAGNNILSYVNPTVDIQKNLYWNKTWDEHLTYLQNKSVDIQNVLSSFQNTEVDDEDIDVDVDVDMEVNRNINNSFNKTLSYLELISSLKQAQEYHQQLMLSRKDIQNSLFQKYRRGDRTKLESEEINNIMNSKKYEQFAQAEMKEYERSVSIASSKVTTIERLLLDYSNVHLPSGLLNQSIDMITLPIKSLAETLPAKVQARGVLKLEKDFSSYWLDFIQKLVKQSISECKSTPIRDFKHDITYFSYTMPTIPFFQDENGEYVDGAAKLLYSPTTSSTSQTTREFEFGQKRSMFLYLQKKIVQHFLISLRGFVTACQVQKATSCPIIPTNLKQNDQFLMKLQHFFNEPVIDGELQMIQFDTIMKILEHSQQFKNNEE